MRNLLVGVGLWVAAFGSGGEAMAAPAEAPRVVAFGMMQIPKRQGGIVRHTLEARVAEVLVAEGDEVKMGQPLLTYRDRDAQARLEAARARFEATLQGEEVSEAALGAARAELTRAEEKVRSLTLTAPATGVITHVTASVGQRAVRKQEAMCLLLPDRKSRVATVVAQPPPGKRGIRAGQAVTVRVAGEDIPAQVGVAKMRKGQLEMTLLLERAPRPFKGPIGVRVTVVDAEERG